MSNIKSSEDKYLQMFIRSQGSTNKDIVNQTQKKVEGLQENKQPPKTVQQQYQQVTSVQNSSQDKYLQMFIRSQEGINGTVVHQTQKKVEGLQENKQLQTKVQQQVKNVQGSSQSKYPQTVTNIQENKGVVVTSNKEKIKIKSEVISNKGEQIKSTIPTRTVEAIKNKKNFENKPKVERKRTSVKKEKQNNLELNPIINFFDKLTCGKFIKIMIIPCILAYFIGTFIGKNLGDLGQIFSKNKKMEEEIESQIKRNNEVVSEKQVEEIVETASIESQNNYAYAYRYGNDMLKERYGVTICYDDELEITPKTLKRTV